MRSRARAWLQPPLRAHGQGPLGPRGIIDGSGFDALHPPLLRLPVQHRRDGGRRRRRGGRLLLLEVLARPAGPRGARQLRAAGDDPRPRRRRQPARGICPRAPALPADPGDAEDRHRGLPVGRGQELLQARRHRSGGHRPCDPDQCLERQEAGRLDHHPAGRQELPALVRADLRPQDPRGADRAAHRVDLLEGQDPRALPQRDLPRHDRAGPQPARHRGRRPRLFRQVGPRADDPRGGLSRGSAQGPEQLPSLSPHPAGAGAPQRDHRVDGPERVHHQGGGRIGAQAAARRQPAHHLAQHRQRELLRRGGPPRDLRALRREEALRGRPVGAHHPRPEDAGDGPQVPRRRPGALRSGARLARAEEPGRARRPRLGHGGGRGAGARRRAALAPGGGARHLRRPRHDRPAAEARELGAGLEGPRDRDHLGRGRALDRPQRRGGAEHRRRRLCRAHGRSRQRLPPAPDPGGVRRHRRHGSLYRSRPRDGRRLLLRRERVQPRHPGDAPARLVVQADRLLGGARQRLHPGLDGPRHPDHHRGGPGQEAWTPTNYGGKAGGGPTPCATASSTRRT